MVVSSSSSLRGSGFSAPPIFQSTFPASLRAQRRSSLPPNLPLTQSTERAVVERRALPFALRSPERVERRVIHVVPAVSAGAEETVRPQVAFARRPSDILAEQAVICPPAARPCSAPQRRPLSREMAARIDALSVAGLAPSAAQLVATVEHINEFICNIHATGSAAGTLDASPLPEAASLSVRVYNVDELEGAIRLNVAVVLVDGSCLAEGVLGPEGPKRYENLATLICDKIQTLLKKLDAKIDRRQHPEQARAHFRADALRNELIPTIVQGVTRSCIQKPGFFSDRTMKLLLLDRFVEIGGGAAASIGMAVTAQLAPSTAPHLNGIPGMFILLFVSSLAALFSSYAVHRYKAHRHEADLLEDLRKAIEHMSAPPEGAEAV